MTKIVANMVIRNEADKYLKPVLERLASQVDLICVTDDCSDDDSAAIAESYGAKVQVMSTPIFATNEYALRQASWDFLDTQVTNDEPWWVLAIDADEMMYETAHPMRELIEINGFEVISIDFYHMWTPTQFRVDKAWHPHGSSRLFKYYTDGLFKNQALACGSEPMYVQQLIRRGRFLQGSGLVMKHLSYMDEEGKRSKYERYAKIDGGLYHANAHIESIMDPDPVLVDWRWD